METVRQEEAAEISLQQLEASPVPEDTQESEREQKKEEILKNVSPPQASGQEAHERSRLCSDASSRRKERFRQFSLAGGRFSITTLEPELVLEEVGRVMSEDELYEHALEALRFGRFHWRLVVTVGALALCQPMLVLSVGALFPALECDPNFMLTAKEDGGITAAVFSGMIVSGYIWGSLSDTYGRKYILIILHTYCSLALALASMAESYKQLVAAFFFVGLGAGGVIPTISTYFIEFHPKHIRGMMAGLRMGLWVVGQVTLSGVAWLVIPPAIGDVPQWRLFLVCSSIPALITTQLFWFLPESPKYLSKKCRFSEAQQILHDIYCENNPGSEHTFQPMKLSADADNPAHFNTGAPNYKISEALILIRYLFTPEYRKIFCLCLAIFLALSSSYSLMLWIPELFKRLEESRPNNSSEIVSVCNAPASFNISSNGQRSACSGDGSMMQAIYSQSFITVTCSIPGYIITIPLLDKLGRKLFLVGGFFLCGLSSVILGYVQTQTEALLVTSLFVCTEAMGWTALGVVALEILPTHLRTLSFALMLCVLRIGNVAGQLTIGSLLDTHCHVILVTVCLMMCLCSLLATLLPNTKDKVLT